MLNNKTLIIVHIPAERDRLSFVTLSILMLAISSKHGAQLSRLLEVASSYNSFKRLREKLELTPSRKDGFKSKYFFSASWTLDFHTASSLVKAKSKAETSAFTECFLKPRSPSLVELRHYTNALFKRNYLKVGEGQKTTKRMTRSAALVLGR